MWQDRREAVPAGSPKQCSLSAFLRRAFSTGFPLSSMRAKDISDIVTSAPKSAQRRLKGTFPPFVKGARICSRWILIYRQARHKACLQRCAARTCATDAPQLERQRLTGTLDFKLQVHSTKSRARALQGIAPAKGNVDSYCWQELHTNLPLNLSTSS